ncbi:hypothetical protein VV867_08750 [Pseudomonas sp. JH-2]|nr:hypothetical protein [Pseudomonas sp. JH-2]
MSEPNRLSRNEKASGAGTPEALDNVKTTEELSVMNHHSISLYRGISLGLAGEGCK